MSHQHKKKQPNELVRINKITNKATNKEEGCLKYKTIT